MHFAFLCLILSFSFQQLIKINDVNFKDLLSSNNYNFIVFCLNNCTNNDFFAYKLFKELNISDIKAFIYDVGDKINFKKILQNKSQCPEITFYKNSDTNIGSFIQIENEKSIIMNWAISTYYENFLSDLNNLNNKCQESCKSLVNMSLIDKDMFTETLTNFHNLIQEVYQMHKNLYIQKIQLDREMTQLKSEFSSESIYKMFEWAFNLPLGIILGSILASLLYRAEII